MSPLDPDTDYLLIGQSARLELNHWFIRVHLSDTEGRPASGGTVSQLDAATGATYQQPAEDVKTEHAEAKSDDTTESLNTNGGSIWAWPGALGGMAALFLIVILAYALGSRLAILLAEASGLDGVFFIPAGITLAFLLRLPRGAWWVVLAGAGLTELVMDLASGWSVSQALGFAAANVVEPLVGATIVMLAVGRLDLARRRHVLWFTLGAVLTGPAIGALIGAAADRLFGADDFLPTFLQWWLGDALGVVVSGSAILVWGSSRDRRSVFSPVGGMLDPRLGPTHRGDTDDKRLSIGVLGVDRGGHRRSALRVSCGGDDFARDFPGYRLDLHRKPRRAHFRVDASNRSSASQASGGNVHPGGPGGRRRVARTRARHSSRLHLGDHGGGSCPGAQTRTRPGRPDPAGPSSR